MEKVREIFDRFDTGDSFVSAEAYGGGHINDTYRVTGMHGQYTLQRINTDIFKDPQKVMENIKNVTSHIEKKLETRGLDPERRRLSVVTANGLPYFECADGFFRMFRFIDGVKTYSKIEKAEDFYKSALAFGDFWHMLSDFPMEVLHETIPNFHNTPSRYRDFCDAVEKNLSGRADIVREETKFIHEHKEFYSIVTDAIDAGDVPLRVTHNDTKLDNILFDEKTGEGLCVIDLDTVMPGSLLYDYGDSLRFGTNTGAEDEADTDKIECRLDLFESFTRGVIRTAGGDLTPREIELFPDAGPLLTLECGMRFLADYINGDIYFKVKDSEHNLRRARAQIALAKDMMRKRSEMEHIVKSLF